MLSVSEIIVSARKLSIEEKLRIIETLLDEVRSGQDIEKEWLVEVERRVSELKHDPYRIIDGESVFGEINQSVFNR